MGVGSVAAPFPSLFAVTPLPLSNMNITVSMIDVGKELHGVKKSCAFLGFTISSCRDTCKCLFP